MRKNTFNLFEIINIRDQNTANVLPKIPLRIILKKIQTWIPPRVPRDPSVCLAQSMHERYIVSVEAEFDSEWYLVPWVFPTHGAALRHAIGIARSWHGKRHAPFIRISSDNGDTKDWTVFGLTSVSYFVEGIDEVLLD